MAQTSTSTGNDNEILHNEKAELERPQNSAAVRINEPPQSLSTKIAYIVDPSTAEKFVYNRRLRYVGTEGVDLVALPALSSEDEDDDIFAAAKKDKLLPIPSTSQPEQSQRATKSADEDDDDDGGNLSDAGASAKNAAGDTASAPYGQSDTETDGELAAGGGDDAAVSRTRRKTTPKQVQSSPWTENPEDIAKNPVFTEFRSRLVDRLKEQWNEERGKNRNIKLEVETLQQQQEYDTTWTYGYQEQLGKAQHELAELDGRREAKQQFLEQFQKRRRELEEVDERYQRRIDKYAMEQRTLRSQMDHLNLQLHDENEKWERVFHAKALMQRTKYHLSKEVQQAEERKRDTDLLVNRLEIQMDSLREQVEFMQATLVAKREDASKSGDLIVGLNARFDEQRMRLGHLKRAIEHDMLNLRTRDEVLAASKKSVGEREAEIHTAQVQLGSLRRQIAQLHVEHEELTLAAINKQQSRERMERRIKRTTDKHEAFSVECNQLEQMLNKVERELDDAATQIKSLTTQQKYAMQELRKAVEQRRMTREKLRAAFNSNLSLQKSQSKSLQLNNELQRERDLMEFDIATLEEEISKLNVEYVHVQDALAAKTGTNNELCGEIDKLEHWLNDEQESIRKRNVFLDRQQGLANVLQTRLTSMINDAGGEEIGPREAMISNIRKDIDTTETAILDSQALWVRQQNENVRLQREREQCLQESTRKDLRFRVLDKTKQRMESDINHECETIRWKKRDDKSMHLQMTKVNDYITRVDSDSDNLKKQCLLREQQIMNELREAEELLRRWANKLDEVEQTNENLNRDITQTEKALQLWEKKLELKRDAKAQLDKDFGESEINNLRMEVHRLRKSLKDTMKDQEQVGVELARAADRRGELYQKHRNITDTPDKRKAMKGQLKRTVSRNARLIALARKDYMAAARDVAQLRNERNTIEDSLMTLAQKMNETLTSIENIKERARGLLCERYKKFIVLYCAQKRRRHYDAAKEGKFKRIVVRDVLASAASAADDDGPIEGDDDDTRSITSISTTTSRTTSLASVRSTSAATAASKNPYELTEEKRSKLVVMRASLEEQNVKLEMVLNQALREPGVRLSDSLTSVS